MKDSVGRFVFFNKQYEELFGISKDQYMGTTVLDLDYLPEQGRMGCFVYEDEDNTKK